MTLYIVIDETTGLNEEHFLQTNVNIFVKFVKLQKKKESLKEYLEKPRPLLFRKSVKIAHWTLEEDIAYFASILQEHNLETIVYFYDPACTSYEKIRRLRNVLLPNYRLYPLPVTTNRAETCFLIEQLAQHKEKVQSAEMTYERLRKMIQSWLTESYGWVMTTNVKSMLSRHKQKTIYRKKQKDIFHQIFISPTGKLEMEARDSFEVLWENLVPKIEKSNAMWMVTKGVEIPDVHNLSIRHVAICENTFPVHVPYVQLFSPSKATLSFEERSLTKQMIFN